MSQLILVRHAHPQVRQETPSRDWTLSDEGRQGALRAAEHLSGSPIGPIFTSSEPKAVETGQIIADILGGSTESRPDLGEHDRTGVGYLDQAAFASCITGLFAEPDRLVFGRETGNEAADRLERALREIDRETDQSLDPVCVTHGTVMSLLAARIAESDGYRIWKNLGMPALMWIDRETWTIERIVSAV